MNSRKRASAVYCGLQWPRFPGESGGEIREFQLIKFLTEHYRLRYVPLWGDRTEEAASGLVAALEEGKRYWPPPPRPAAAGMRSIARLLHRAPGLPTGRLLPADVRSHVRVARAARPRLEAALQAEPADFLFVSPQLNAVAFDGALSPSGPRRILSTYDVESVRVKRLASSFRGWRRAMAHLDARLSARFERAQLARFDGVIAVSELDAETYRGRLGVPAESLVVVENGVDPEQFAFRRPGAPPEPPVVVFVGALSYQPNEDAAFRLARRIMPRVRAVRDARLLLVGQAPSQALMRLHDGDRTIVTGRVADVRPFLGAASLTCVPLETGSGTKIKVLEAMSAGVPIVCSTVAAEGLAIAPDAHALVVDADVGLADAVLRVLGDQDLAARLADAARELVERRYAWSRTLSPLVPWLDGLHLRSSPA